MTQPLRDPLKLFGLLTVADQRLARSLMRLSQVDRQELLTSARSCRDIGDIPGAARVAPRRAGGRAAAMRAGIPLERSLLHARGLIELADVLLAVRLTPLHAELSRVLDEQIGLVARAVNPTPTPNIEHRQ
jgi:hypothetical protein